MIRNPSEEQRCCFTSVLCLSLLSSATTVTTSSSWCIPGSSLPVNRPRFETYSTFLLLVSLFSSWKSFVPLLTYFLPFKSLFKNPPSLCSRSVWEEGSRLNGSQRGPWTSRGETLDLAQALNHPQISPPYSLRVSSHSPPSPPSSFLVDSPAVDPDEQGPALRRWM